MQKNTQNLTVQKIVTVAIIGLFIIKLIAWYATKSVAILTDAVEYIINVITGFIGLYSIYLASLPPDANHPYGHGKAEFISAAIEGTLMVVSSVYISYRAIVNLTVSHTVQQLNVGIILIALTAVVNYMVGLYALRKGISNNSLALQATGKHMQTDTYATLAIVLGLVIIYVTNYTWVDSVVALIFALIILYNGATILRSSIAGIMDEADDKLLEQLITELQQKRLPTWVDLHNLRIIKYGGILHIDCHLTVPWYFNVQQAHTQVDALRDVVNTKFGQQVELFVHTDACMPTSCNLCAVDNCTVRTTALVQQVQWTTHNILANTRHRLL